MTVLVRYNYSTFLCRPLQNNNKKWPNSALSGEREPRRPILKFLFPSYWSVLDSVS